MKKIVPKESFGYSFDTPPVSTGEVLNEELTEQQNAIAWSEFEYEMYLLNKEDNN